MDRGQHRHARRVVKLRAWQQGALAGGATGLITCGAAAAIADGWSAVGSLAEWAGAAGTVGAVIYAGQQLRYAAQTREEDHLRDQRRRLESAVAELNDAHMERGQMMRGLAKSPRSGALRETSGKVEKLTGNVRRLASCLEDRDATKARKACDLIDDIWMAVMVRGLRTGHLLGDAEELVTAFAMRPLNEAVYGPFPRSPERVYGRVATFVDEGIGDKAMAAVTELLDEPSE